MLKIIRIVLQISVIAMAGYALISSEMGWMPLVMLLAGLFMLVAGFEQIEKNQKEFWGYAYVVIALFIFAVSWQGFYLGV
jgi:asparagine N-glycosylation enzyme membrane subunit Stt3